MAFGGAQAYRGPSLRAAHMRLLVRLNVSQKHFDAVVGHLLGSLADLGVPPQLVAGEGRSIEAQLPYRVHASVQRGGGQHRGGVGEPSDTLRLTVGSGWSDGSWPCSCCVSLMVEDDAAHLPPAPRKRQSCRWCFDSLSVWWHAWKRLTGLTLLPAIVATHGQMGI